LSRLTIPKPHECRASMSRMSLLGGSRVLGTCLALVQGTVGDDRGFFWADRTDSRSDMVQPDTKNPQPVKELPGETRANRRSARVADSPDSFPPGDSNRLFSLCVRSPGHFLVRPAPAISVSRCGLVWDPRFSRDSQGCRLKGSNVLGSICELKLDRSRKVTPPPFSISFSLLFRPLPPSGRPMRYQVARTLHPPGFGIPDPTKPHPQRNQPLVSEDGVSAHPPLI